jgi:hypothetical protein
MRLLAAVTIATGFVPHALAAQISAGDASTRCAPEGDVQFVCGQSAAEDLAYIPGTDWVLASSLHGKAEGIRVISVRDKTITTLYPSAGAKDRLDSKTYDSCPGPLAADDKAMFVTHGLALSVGHGGMYRLYAVHHGKRESIEVFELNARGKAPLLTWIGCAIAPDPIGLNSVVGLSDGGFIATNFAARGEGAQASHAKMTAGEINGDVQEWHPGRGWTKLPGSESSGANGVELSKDGKWIYIDGWGSKSFIRLSRGRDPVKRDSVALDFRIDNVHWAPDGTLLGVGQGQNSTRMVRIDPQTLKVTDLVNRPDTDVFSAGTGAAQVGDEIWVGSFRSYSIAIFPASKRQ